MARTRLLQQAITELEALPAAAQDAIVECVLELLDEQRWDALFAATTREQWARIMTYVRAEIAAGNAVPLDQTRL